MRLATFYLFKERFFSFSIFFFSFLFVLSFTYFLIYLILSNDFSYVFVLNASNSVTYFYEFYFFILLISSFFYFNVRDVIFDYVHSPLIRIFFCYIVIFLLFFIFFLILFI